MGSPTRSPKGDPRGHGARRELVESLVSLKVTVERIGRGCDLVHQDSRPQLSSQTWFQPFSGVQV